jgi:cell division protein FtsZ
MIQFDLPKEKSSIIKVIGVGGGGSNAVNHMFDQNIEGVNFIICNTDAQAITQSLVPNKVQLGPHLTQGLGAGANPEIGRQATEESLEEIRRILEVNTKMAFITAGMGGGTGTGGAPIISKICKDLGILTVGIVTTPFSYEGKKRQLQAEEGIKILKNYVDTLLVISNDKLRHQFGNLKMKEAFAKADNVLATAAKCITDVINSTGQINVDFADVCTVMRNGGVAILGNATAGGDNRAQRAIEEALNSPLLNDNDISGAKWILININSSEGEHEFTMDEVDIIQNHLLSQAGEGTDVILGLGYDNSLNDKIGITLIATGFEHKDPFTKLATKAQPVAATEERDQKIILELNPNEVAQPTTHLDLNPNKTAAVPEEPVVENKTTGFVAEPEKKLPEELAPKLVEVPPVTNNSKSQFELFPAAPVEEPEVEDETLSFPSFETSLAPTDEPGESVERIEWVLGDETPDATTPPQDVPQPKAPANNSADAAFYTNDVKPPVSGGYLARPKNIYSQETPPPPASPAPKAYVQQAPAVPPVQNIAPQKPVNAAPQPAPKQPEPPAQINSTVNPVENNQNEMDEMQLVIKENKQEQAIFHENAIGADDVSNLNKEELDKRKAMERIQKLRNLSFNINAADPNNEFETVPAYIRRNLDLYNTYSSVENFYSNYEIKADDENKSQISTINTFLDGKKPD